MTAKTNES